MPVWGSFKTNLFIEPPLPGTKLVLLNPSELLLSLPVFFLKLLLIHVLVLSGKKIVRAPASVGR